MANKKSKVKAHRGFAHVRLKPRRPTGDPAPKRPIGRPQRPQIPRLPRRPQTIFTNKQLQKMSDVQLRRYFNAQRRKAINRQLSPQYRRDYLKRLRESNLSPQKKAEARLRFDMAMANLRKGLDNKGKPIPKGIDIVKQFRKVMEQDRKRFQQMKKQQQKMPTKKSLEEVRKSLSQNLSPNINLSAAMGSKKQTAAPAQQAVINPNIRRRIPNRRRTMVSKGGAVRKKK